MASGESLAFCRRCGAERVVPVRWSTYDAARWWIRLRCGECGATRETIVTNDEARAFDRRVRWGTEQIAAALARLDMADFR